VRRLGDVRADEAALDVLAERDEHRVVVVLATLLRRMSPRLTFSRSVFGISMPTADLPGIGLMMRTSATSRRTRCCG
jgi:hypothetical protein